MGTTVLIVEDDPDCREVMCAFAALRGYGVTLAANGREALELLRSADPRPGLILLDLSLPVMSGWEFRERQVRDLRLADIPVIVVSAAREAIDSEYSSLDANAYLKKPIDFDELGALLDSYCI